MSAAELDAVLAYCNEKRRAYGLRPLRKVRQGAQDEPCNCPVANTIRGGSHGEGLPVKAQYERIKIASDIYSTPLFVKSFMRAFDAGLYPELEL